MQKKARIKLITFIISFLWISLGTFIQISGYPAYNYFGFDYNSSIYWFLWWITFPFNIILFALLFAEKLSDIYIFVILLQSVKVLLYWWLLYKAWLFVQKRRKSRRKNKEDDVNISQQSAF